MGWTEHKWGSGAGWGEKCELGLSGGKSFVQGHGFSGFKPLGRGLYSDRTARTYQKENDVFFELSHLMKCVLFEYIDLQVVSFQACIVLLCM